MIVSLSVCDDVMFLFAAPRLSVCTQQQPIKEVKGISYASVDGRQLTDEVRTTFCVLCVCARLKLIVSMRVHFFAK